MFIHYKRRVHGPAHIGCGTPDRQRYIDGRRAVHVLGHGNQRRKAFATAHVPLHKTLLLQGNMVKAELAEPKMIPAPVGHNH